MKHGSYYTRALQTNDPRYARVFHKMGYGRADLVAVEGDANPGGDGQESGEAELARLRDEYHALLNKKPYRGWDVAVLAEKIAAAKAAD